MAAFTLSPEFSLLLSLTAAWISLLKNNEEVAQTARASPSSTGLLVVSPPTASHDVSNGPCSSRANDSASACQQAGEACNYRAPCPRSKSGAIATARVRAPAERLTSGEQVINAATVDLLESARDEE